MKSEPKLVDLGWCVAKLHENKNYLTILSPSDFSDGGFSPAQSVSLWQEVDILKLRDFLVSEFPL